MMDVQMPGMSGLEATRTIRATEARRRLVRVPILAVTAGAMAGDRQACLDAGMDGYVTKPVSPQLLLGEVDRVLAETGQRADTAPPPPEAPGGFEAEPDAGPTDHHRSSPQPSVDLDKLRRRLDGDEATLKELAHAMRLDLAERLEALRLALAQRDGTAAVAHAHGLKGSLGSMTAEKGARLAKGLE
ncbi:response regulator, partial [Aphanothece microscopica]|uniref:response regulator n=1 Tax=Aphanothece microscopica TaxID=1049561 RepID=UPI003984BABB